MSNQFTAIPATAANGPGTAVDMTSYGAAKTITVTGNGSGGQQPFVGIEISNDSDGLAWTPIGMFRAPGVQTFATACRWIRTNVTSYAGGGAPVVELGGTDDGTTLIELVAPAANGTGAAVNTSAQPTFQTIQVSGDFEGSLNVLVSEDGGTTFQTLASFSQPGIQTFSPLVADYMRVSRNGVPLVNPGSTPTINIGATASGSDGSSAVLTDGITVIGDGTLNNKIRVFQGFAPARQLFVAESWPASYSPTVYFTSIQAAINQAVTLTPTNANPVAIEISPGTYTGNITCVSSVSLSAVGAGGISTVFIAGTVTWLPGQGANVPQTSATEAIAIAGCVITGLFTIDSTLKTTGSVQCYVLEPFFQGGIAVTGRAAGTDNFFMYNGNFVTGTSSWSFTNWTGSTSGIGVEIVGSRLRGIAFAGATARIQGGETVFVSGKTYALTAAAAVTFSGVPINNVITAAAGCTVATPDCSINQAPTGAGAFDFRGAAIEVSLAGITGTCDRDKITGTTGSTAADDTSITITPALPNANYVVNLQLVAGAGNAGTLVNTKAAGSFNIHDTVHGNTFDYLLTRAPGA